MPVFKPPLSGDVVQSINPLTAFMTGGQFGLVNVTIGQSSAPDVEKDVLSDVASYGKQLGQIGDALLVVIERLVAQQPDLAKDDAIRAFENMLHQIADVKTRHHRAALRPRRPG